MRAADWWKDEDLQRHLLSLLCRDRNFLKKFGSTLTAKDFRARKEEPQDRFVIAKLAIEFWKKYKAPIGTMLRTNVTEWGEEQQKSAKDKLRLSKLVDEIVRGDKLVAVEAMEARVEKYIALKSIALAAEEVLTKQAEGTLDRKTFRDIANRLEEGSVSKRVSTDILSDKAFNDRLGRRASSRYLKRPYILIKELDERTNMIGRGDLGLVVGLYKKGKSSLLSHWAVAYAKQRLNVLYFTLEDPVEEVEDRFDASIAYMAIDKLSKLPNKLKKRFTRFRKQIAGRIRVVDCTDGLMTMGEIEEIYCNHRNQGFDADVVIIDYDKELVPRGKYRERRFEFEEIYTDMRQFLARYQLYGWTACQTKRLKGNKKVVTNDDIGEDIGKAQKCTMTLNIGQGEFDRDARHIYVGAHKRGMAEFGVDIMGNFKMGIFYDPDLTFEMQKAIRRSKKIAERMTA
jgi:hypothetical protein